jgi:hypothetical protein
MGGSLVVCALFCGNLVVSGSAIAVNGGGNGACTFQESSYGVSFVGSNGTDEVSVSASIGGCLGPSTSVLIGDVTGSPNGGFASIDSVLSDFFTFSIGDGSGELTLFSGGNPSNVLAQADLTGYVTITNYQVIDSFGDRSFDISVSSTPEPSAFALAGIAIAGMALRRSSR